MKEFFQLFLLCFLFTNSLFCQDQVKEKDDNQWNFYPFSIDLSAGAWIPTGKLSASYNTSLQFGAGLGILVSEKMRAQLWLMPRILNQRSPIFIKVNNSAVQFQENSVGGSLGGWLSYNVLTDKMTYTEIITGLTWEDIPTDIMKNNEKEKLSISGLGLSLGLNSWINFFPKTTFGLRAVYTYSTFDKSRYLASSIGGNLVTFSLMYRIPKRNQTFKN